MLIFMCALHCEAKPLIDHYRLKKLPQSDFDSYAGDGKLCIVSGIGELNMAEACAWAGALQKEQTNAWINLGVAGHASLELGSAMLVNKVSQAHADRPIYPVHLLDHSFNSIPLISVRAESRDYDHSAAYDMEGYAFFHACSRFSPLELCQGIKIISDNRDNPPLRDKSRISQMIGQHIPAIDEFANKLEQLAQEQGALTLTRVEIQRFLVLAHFTQTQQNQLNTTLLGLRAFDAALDETYALATQQDGSKAIISALKTRLQQKCEVL